MHGKKSWVIVEGMPATIEVKLASKRAQRYYTEGKTEDFFKKWAQWDLDRGVIEEIIFKQNEKEWYCLFSTKNTSIKLPIAVLYFDFDIDAEFVNKDAAPLKWAKSGTRIPQNDGKALLIDWGECKNGIDSAESASESSDDNYYQNIAASNYRNDANNDCNLPSYLDDNIDNISNGNILANENMEFDNSHEYDGDLSTNEEDENFYNEYGLNHDVSYNVVE